MGFFSGWFSKTAEPAIAEFKLRERRHQFVADLTGDDRDAATSGAAFQPEQSYFSVRIVEMRLTEAGRYFTEYVPMCSCFLRYTYGSKPEAVPMVIGTETLRQALGANAPADAARRVEFSNIYAARNIPVKADNLTLFTGLCRFKDSAFARGLIDLIAEGGETIGGATVGAPLRTAGDLTKKLMGLLGADGVETLFGRYDGNALTKSGYRVLAASADDALAGRELRIANGVLQAKQDGAFKQVDDADYLLLAFEHRATLVDQNFAFVSILPFHEYWRDAAKAISGRKSADTIDELMNTLRSAVEVAPELTEADRAGVILMYEATAAQRRQGYASTRSGGATASLQSRLIARADAEHKSGSDIAELLEAAQATLSEHLAAMLGKDPPADDPDAGLADTFARFAPVLLDKKPEQLARATRAIALAAGG